MYSNNAILVKSKIGFEFEFFSKLNISETKNSIANFLNKKISIEDKAHSSFVPTSENFKIEPDNSGGTGMIELVTGALPFVEAKLILSKMLTWIKKNGSTNDRCSIHINISFGGSKAGTDLNISKLDIGKFVLNFDEDKVYDKFPDRKDSVYAKSIKFIMPINNMTQRSSSRHIFSNYILPSEKYYGINFSKTTKGYLEFRYLGGADYEKRYDDIVEMITHFIISLYNILKNPAYTKEDDKKLDDLLKRNKIFINSYKSYKVFKENHKDIKITVDLSTDEQRIETYYTKIRDKIFDLLSKCNFSKGFINYDTDLGKIQIKDAELNKCYFLSDVDIVECKIKGNIKNCDIFDSEITDSSIDSSNAFGDTVITGSKIQNSYISKSTKVKNSYVFGKLGVFSGKMDGGIFREGRATKLAKFSDKTEIIEIEKIN